jgi:hypothetical protein
MQTARGFAKIFNFREGPGLGAKPLPCPALYNLTLNFPEKSGAGA